MEIKVLRNAAVNMHTTAGEQGALQVYHYLGPRGKIRYRLNLSLDNLRGLNSSYPDGFDNCPRSFRTAQKARQYAINRGWTVI